MVDDYDNLTVLPIEVKSGKDYQIHSALNKLLSNNDYNVKKAIVLSEDNNVLWVLGGRRSTSYKIREDSRLIMKVEYKGEKE